LLRSGNVTIVSRAAFLLSNVKGTARQRNVRRTAGDVVKIPKNREEKKRSEEDRARRNP